MCSAGVGRCGGSELLEPDRWQCSIVVATAAVGDRGHLQVLAPVLERSCHVTWLLVSDAAIGVKVVKRSS
jgi:hypothetical protein